MSDRPDKCRWCGCAEITRDGFPEIDGGREVLFACRSVWYETAMGWVRDPEQCGGQAGVLYKRIAAAVEALKAVPRYAMEADSHLAVLPLPDRQGDWVWCEDIDAVRDILQGNSPEIPEGAANSENEQ